MASKRSLEIIETRYENRSIYLEELNILVNDWEKGWMKKHLIVKFGYVRLAGGEFKQKCNSLNAYDLCEFLGDDEICVWIQP